MCILEHGALNYTIRRDYVKHSALNYDKTGCEFAMYLKEDNYSINLLIKFSLKFLDISSHVSPLY